MRLCDRKVSWVGILGGEGAAIKVGLWTGEEREIPSVEHFLGEGVHDGCCRDV